MTDDEDWKIARSVCTPAELECLELHERLGYKRIAATLGLSISTVRGRIDRAEAKIRRERVARKKASSIQAAP